MEHGYKCANCKLFGESFSVAQQTFQFFFGITQSKPELPLFAVISSEPNQINNSKFSDRGQISHSNVVSYFLYSKSDKSVLQCFLSYL
jgi:hypothetical protein